MCRPVTCQIDSPGGREMSRPPRGSADLGFPDMGKLSAAPGAFANSVRSHARRRAAPHVRNMCCRPRGAGVAAGTPPVLFIREFRIATCALVFSRITRGKSNSERWLRL